MAYSSLISSLGDTGNLQLQNLPHLEVVTKHSLTFRKLLMLSKTAYAKFEIHVASSNLILAKKTRVLQL